MSFDVARFSDGITETKYDFALFFNGEPVAPISKEQLKEYRKTKSIKGIFEENKLLIDKFCFEESSSIPGECENDKTVTSIKSNFESSDRKKTLNKSKHKNKESSELTLTDMKALFSLSLEDLNKFHPSMRSFLKKQIFIIKNDDDLIENYHAKLLWGIIKDNAVGGELALGNRVLAEMGISTSVLKPARENLVKLKLISFKQKIINSRVRNVYKIL